MDALDQVVNDMIETLERKKKEKPSQFKNRTKIDDIKEQLKFERENRDYD